MERVSRRGMLAVSAGLVGAAGMVDTTRPTEAEGTNAKGSHTINHIVIFGGSPETVIEYEFTVSGRLRKSGSGDGAPIEDRFVTLDGEDHRSNRGRSASGAIAGGGDAYRFTGRITRFRGSLSAKRQNEVKIYLNGRRVRPDELGDSPAANTPIEFLDCNTARVRGSFRGVELNTSFWDETGLGTNVLFPGAVSGTTILHPAAAHNPYPFAIDSVSLDTRTLEYPGQSAKFTADNPYAGPWCRKAKRHRSRTGTESEKKGKRKSNEKSDKQAAHIEFLGCERAMVTGKFERVSIDSSWYDSSGIATSYNEIGPVSGRTQIDSSNVGDIGGPGFVIVNIIAYESGSAEPTISKRNPNTDACNRKLERKTTGTTETKTTETTTTGTETTDTTRKTQTKRETTRQDTATPTTSQRAETSGKASTSRESSTPVGSTESGSAETADTGDGTPSGSGESGSEPSESGASGSGTSSGNDTG